MAPSNNCNQNTNQPPVNINQPPPVNDQPPPNAIDINSPNNPLYLHPNDHPGLVLNSKKLIGSENYSSCKRSMMIALNAKNKLKIVTGEMIEPTVNQKKEHCCENGKNNGDKEQRKRLIKFLMGLDECYSNLRGQILLLQPLPLVAKAYGMVQNKNKEENIEKKKMTNTPFSIGLNTPDSSVECQYAVLSLLNTPYCLEIDTPFRQ
ncbi:cysteine-rich receptor-like protein kinase 8 [Tanacetum coccineum]|uniref:Cysteine-rich receptor-like protein kinase 8 n=1 Tax=Tanacetum coccineum TaxID=301880 RepID=A0ABQ4WHJ6_9ASTR